MILILQKHRLFLLLKNKNDLNFFKFCSKFSMIISCVCMRNAPPLPSSPSLMGPAHKQKLFPSIIVNENSSLFKASKTPSFLKLIVEKRHHMCQVWKICNFWARVRIIHMEGKWSTALHRDSISAKLQSYSPLHFVLALWIWFFKFWRSFSTNSFIGVIFV